MKPHPFDVLQQYVGTAVAVVSSGVLTSRGSRVQPTGPLPRAVRFICQMYGYSRRLQQEVPLWSPLSRSASRHIGDFTVRLRSNKLRRRRALDDVAVLLPEFGRRLEVAPR